MLLFVGHLLDCACSGVRVVVGVVLFENCIVDASIFFILCNFCRVIFVCFSVVCEGRTVDALAQ